MLSPMSKLDAEPALITRFERGRGCVRPKTYCLPVLITRYGCECSACIGTDARRYAPMTGADAQRPVLPSNQFLARCDRIRREVGRAAQFCLPPSRGTPICTVPRTKARIGTCVQRYYIKVISFLLTQSCCC